MTTNADGTFSWNIASSSTGNFEATVDTDVYPDPSSQLVNTGGGYLMMIPQTLPTGARLIVGVDDGRPDVEFDLSGITWSPGQRIDYSFIRIPRCHHISAYPGKNRSSAYGRFFAVQRDGRERGLPKPGPYRAPISIFCDNLADLQGWAAANAGLLPPT
ncbi:MAG: hypothetical protein ACLTZY_11165 [Alistipes indistinctus]